MTITDDDERGVTVPVAALTVREGPDGASYTVVLGSQPTSTVTVRPTPQSPPSGANLTISPSSLSFSTSDWSTPKTVTVTAGDDPDVEEDAVIELAHTVSGGDYGANSVAAAAVTVTVLGFEEAADGTVTLRVPASGEVTVPEGATSVPPGTRVTLPSALAGGTVTIEAVADDDPVLDDPPRGFRTGDAVLDIESNPPLPAGQTAVVCLPATSGSQRVHHYDESLDPPEWVELEPPAGGSPGGLACGVTDSFSLFALGSAPNEGIAKEWLARFGRTSAQHVLDGILERLSAPREPGFQGTVAGQGLRAQSGRPGSDGLETRDWADDGLSPWQTGTGYFFGPVGEETGSHGWSRSISVHELIAGTAFTATGEAGDGSFAMWGRGAYSRFDGHDGRGALDGAVATVTIGGDWATGRRIVGMALSRSKGSGSYRLDEDDQEERIEASVTGVYPYFGYQLTERASAWAAAGYGEGRLVLMPAGGDRIGTDLTQLMAAVGLRHDLLSHTGSDGPALALDMDSLFVRTSTASVSSEAGDLAAVAADTSRMRLRLNGSWALTLEDEARLTPALEIGLRHDGGDAETGFGLELGGGVAYAVPARGLAGELNGRWLLAHNDDDFHEWGVSGSLRYDPQPSSERGLSLSVTPSLGAPSTGGVDALFNQGVPAGPSADNGSGADRWPDARLQTELNYGFSALGGSAVQVPSAGWSMTESGEQTVRLGWQLRFGSAGSLGMEASRAERTGEVPDHRFGIVLRLPLGTSLFSPAITARR